MLPPNHGDKNEAEEDEKQDDLATGEPEISLPKSLCNENIGDTVDVLAFASFGAFGQKENGQILNGEHHSKQVSN